MATNLLQGMANLFSPGGSQRLGETIAAFGSTYQKPRQTFFGLLPQGLGAAIAGRSQPYAMGSTIPNFYTPSSDILSNAPRITPNTRIPGTSTIPSFNNNISSPGGFVPINPVSSIPEIPSQQDFESQLNAAAGGAYSALASQEAALRGQQPLTEADITQMGVSQSTPFTQAQQKGQAGYTQQESQTQQAQQNAMQQARQLFNELAQYNQARFGSESSTGPASMELLSRATQQQFGNIGNIAQNNIQQINNARQQLDTYTDNKIASINASVQQEIAKSRQWFQDQLNQINTSRDTIESDKAAQRYQALRDREGYAQAIQAKALDYQMQLDNWRRTQQESLTSSLSQYQQTMPFINAGNLQNQANQYQQTVPRAAGSQIPSLTSGNPSFTTATPGFFANATQRTAVRQLPDGTWVDANGNPV